MGSAGMTHDTGRSFAPVSSAARRLLAAAILLTACSSSTAPVLEADPGLTFDAAHARWLASRPASYTFEFDTFNAWGTSPGPRRAKIVDGLLSEVILLSSGAPLALEQGFTIDQLWERLETARSGGESVTELQFSAQGIPIRAMVGTFANDGGVRYVLRTFAPLGP